MGGPIDPRTGLLGGRTRSARPSPDRSSMAQLARQTLAVVLAGGRGTRLGPLTDLRAKPAVPFGGKFRIIDFTLSNCLNSGIRRIGIATQYHSHGLIHHVQRGWSFLDGRFNEFIELLPAQQTENTDWYKGTADAVWQNLEAFRRHEPHWILVLAGLYLVAIGVNWDPVKHVRVRSQYEMVTGLASQPQNNTYYNPANSALYSDEMSGTFSVSAQADF